MHQLSPTDTICSYLQPAVSNVNSTCCWFMCATFFRTCPYFVVVHLHHHNLVFCLVKTIDKPFDQTHVISYQLVGARPSSELIRPTPLPQRSIAISSQGPCGSGVVQVICVWSKGLSVSLPGKTVQLPPKQRWQVDKEAIGVSRVNIFTFMCNPPS